MELAQRWNPFLHAKHNAFYNGGKVWNGIFIQKLFWTTVKKNVLMIEKIFCRFEVEGQEFSKFWDSYINSMKCQNNFRNKIPGTCYRRFQSDILHWNNQNTNWNKELGCITLQEHVWKKKGLLRFTFLAFLSTDNDYEIWDWGSP